WKIPKRRTKLKIISFQLFIAVSRCHNFFKTTFIRFSFFTSQSSG
ncbi:MAG: hypothetical protein AVDCRST_MAG96-2719, partial [uncultured Segetibacter sp.]